MSSATLNIKVSPRRMLTLREAAEYCGLSVKLFGRLCKVPPVKLADGSERHDMRDLDDWIDGIKLGSSDTDADVLARLT